MSTAAMPLLDPRLLGGLHDLTLAARVVVEGLQAGTHRSPHLGQSVDFADHRAYVAGDDLRHLDWKVLGRSDRLMIKRYEAETDLGLHLAVDGSGSMAYQGERAQVSKYRYAAILAASLAWLVLRQHDRAGLVLFAEDVLVERRPVAQGQLERICRDLEAHVPTAGTDSIKGLQRMAAAGCRRGLVILLTDGLEEPDAIATALDRLRHRGHDAALLWILDPDELDLGLAHVSRLDGLEGEEPVVIEPRALRHAYRQEVEAHRLRLEHACRERRVAFVPCSTGQDPRIAINRLLVALQK